jgi:hypothetical protein
MCGKDTSMAKDDVLDMVGAGENAEVDDVAAQSSFVDVHALWVGKEKEYRALEPLFIQWS